MTRDEFWELNNTMNDITNIEGILNEEQIKIKGFDYLNHPLSEKLDNHIRKYLKNVLVRKENQLKKAKIQ